MRFKLTADPIQLVWMVNQIDDYTPCPSFQSPSPSRRAGWGRTESCDRGSGSLQSCSPPGRAGWGREFSVRAALLALVFSLGMTAATGASAKDWPQWCGSDGKNMVSEEKGLPESFSPGQKRSDGTIDLATASNVKWGVKLGDAFYSTPSVAGGKVYVGGLDGSNGIFVCFDAATGKRLWQWKAPPREVPHTNRRLFHRHQRRFRSRSEFARRRRSKGTASTSFPTASTCFAWTRPVRGRRPATPASCGASTCGRNWACFPAMPRTLLP